MSNPPSPPRHPEIRPAELPLRRELRIDPAAEVLNGRKSLQSALSLPVSQQLQSSGINPLRPNEPLDPVLRHHLRR